MIEAAPPCVVANVRSAQWFLVTTLQGLNPH
jgi:hypothetical protein